LSLRHLFLFLAGTGIGMLVCGRRDEVVGVTLLDESAPQFDFALREHLPVEAPPHVVYAALTRFDSARPRMIDGTTPPLRPRTGVPGFDEILATANWVVLGRRPGTELVLGAAGRFWTPFMDWQDLTAGEFATFARPRRAKIAISFGVHSCGLGRTLLTFEARTMATDRVAYGWADWYWHTIRPTARLVVRGLLRRIRCGSTLAPTS
jgi:hypothetical protein